MALLDTLYQIGRVKMKRHLVLLFFNLNLLGLVYSMTSQEVQQNIEMGNRLLAAGQLADALTHYHNAIDGDPKNYMSYFKRGTVFLAMGKFKSALQDLDRVIELKPDFVSARMQRANVLTKQGLFEDAIKDYNLVLNTESTNTEARTRIDRLYNIVDDLGRVDALIAAHDFLPAIELLTQILEICPWSTEIHELRSDCYLKIGEPSKAILDLNALAKLIPDNTKAYYKLSELNYALGDAEYALNNIRECLKLDPDHKKCSDYYKMLKKLNKIIEKTKKSLEEQKYGECVASARQMIEHDEKAQSFVNKGQSYVCSCSSKGKDTKLAIEACTKVLDNAPNDAEALYNRAQAYITDELLEQGQRDCQKANEIENSQRTQECLERINKLIKQSKKKDYYKILGVKRTADKGTITKAYRKLAHQWHPDKFSEGPEKEKAQKVFIDIAAAKEVLTDPEKRARFDNGEDPLDPEEQAHQHHHGGFHGNPFGGGFNPFGNGNFQFKFKFN